MLGRFLKLFLIVLIVGSLGVLSRLFSDYLPDVISLYSGDTLWAFAAYYVIRFFLPASGVTGVAVIAYMFSVLIEITQLARYSWLQDIRHTLAGGLMLGYGFRWSDLLCYFVGIVLAALFDRFIIHTKMWET